MKIFMKCLGVASAIALGLTAAESFSYETGDVIVRVGAATVDPHEDSSAITLNGTNLEDLGLPRSQAGVDGNTQLGLTLSYLFAPHWGIELLAATPFSHDITVSGLNLKAGSTKQLPPTLSLQYYPMSPGSALQPYVGLGVNYTVFFDEDVDSELNSALIGLGASGNTDLTLEDSVGLAAQLGVDYRLNERWVINAALWYIDIDTEAEFTTPGRSGISISIPKPNSQRRGWVKSRPMWISTPWVIWCLSAINFNAAGRAAELVRQLRESIKSGAVR